MGASYHAQASSTPPDANPVHLAPMRGVLAVCLVLVALASPGTAAATDLPIAISARRCQTLFARRTVRVSDFALVAPCVEFMYPRASASARRTAGLLRAQALLKALTGQHPLRRASENRALDLYIGNRQPPQLAQELRARVWLQGLLGDEESCLANFESETTRFIAADAELGRDLARLFWLRGKTSLAERAATHAAMLLPTDSLPQRELAQLQLAKGELELAMLHLRRAIELGDASDSVRVDLAVVNAMQGRAQAAWLALQTPAQDEPSLRRTLLRVVLTLEASLLDDAKTHALAATQSFPGSVEAWTLLARVHRARREQADSLASYRRVLELAAENTEALRAVQDR